MQWVPEVLQLSIVVERVGALRFEPEAPKKLDLVFGHSATERGVVKEFSESRLFLERLVGLPLNKVQSSRAPRNESVVQYDFHAKGREVDVPGLNQWV